MGVGGVLEHLREILVLYQLTDLIHIPEDKSNVLLIGLVSGVFQFRHPVTTQGDR